MTEPRPHRRSRRRASSAQGPPTQKPPTQNPPAAVTTTAATPPAPAARKPGRRPQRDAGLRDIVGAGHSQLSPVGAMRARDLNRPTDDDLAAAERETVIVRRNWKPAPDVQS